MCMIYQFEGYSCVGFEKNLNNFDASCEPVVCLLLGLDLKWKSPGLSWIEV